MIPKTQIDFIFNSVFHWARSQIPRGKIKMSSFYWATTQQVISSLFIQLKQVDIR